MAATNKMIQQKRQKVDRQILHGSVPLAACFGRSNLRGSQMDSPG